MVSFGSNHILKDWHGRSVQCAVADAHSTSVQCHDRTFLVLANFAERALWKATSAVELQHPLVGLGETAPGFLARGLHAAPQDWEPWTRHGRGVLPKGRLMGGTEASQPVRAGQGSSSASALG